MNAPDFYETERALSEYLLFHYGPDDLALPWSFGPSHGLNYPARCVSECLLLERLPSTARALDLGCAVGRSSFELARHCATVVGIDYSQRFVGVAQRLQRDGAIAFSCVEEGELTVPATATVPPEIARGRVAFERGDAQALREDLGTFDVVLMANLVDRLADPGRCLAQLPALVNPAGQLIITTPCTWLDAYTPRAHWLGGFEREGQAVRTRDMLQRILGPHFALARSLDLPFLIREHARKFQWSVAMATVWLRR